MKITIYTITDCPFSKQEREYLSAHGLPFEEKNLETNREFLTEMLAVGSNFAGTPLTKVEKDDGQIIVLKGFTLAEFDKTLGVDVEPKKAPDVQTVSAAPPVAAAAVAPPAQPKPAQPPIDQPIMPVAQPKVPQVAPAPVEDPAMSSVLNNLQQQAEVADPSLTVEQVPVAPVTPVTPDSVQPPVAGTPVIPDPQF